MSVIIGGYEIDCAEAEEHVRDSDVTDHPVEKGADTADNIRARAIALTVTGIVTNTPVGPIADRRGDRDANGMLVFNPADDALAWLEAIRLRREPVTVVTSKETYAQMAMEKLSFTVDSKTGDAFRFRASFKQVALVTNERTTIRVAAPRAAGKVNRGNKPSPAAPDDAPPVPEKPERNRSVLAKGRDALLRFLD